MKISRRSVLWVSGTALAALVLSGCGASGEMLGGRVSGMVQRLLNVCGYAPAASSGASSAAASQAASDASSVQSSSAGLISLPEYDADPLTGEARKKDARLVGVMVNNISNTKRQNARPQRGLSSASILIECKVEGSISRFCAVYGSVNDVPEVGPLRSGRDQFLQLIMPWRALYYHDGESMACTKFINTYDYEDLNIGGKSYFNTTVHPHIGHRDSRGRDVAYEHTEFTSGTEIKKAAANAGIDLSEPFEGTAFKFADYRTLEVNRMKGCASATVVSVTHSANYRTSFKYDRFTQSYKMSMYSACDKAFSETVDELNDKQLAFVNLLVCFADIAAYAGDSGDVQQVQYINGGEAYLFTRGAVQTGHWEKAYPTQPLVVRGEDVEELLLNRGKTYLAIVDNDEWENFSYQ